MAGDVDALLKSIEWAERSEAIRRIEVRKDGKAVPQLIDRLGKDESQFVRAAAARALGKIGSAEAVGPLARALADPAFHVRQNAMWSLGEIGAAAEPALPALRPLAASRERFPQAELTVAEMAGLTIARIEIAVEAAKTPVEAPAVEEVAEPAAPPAAEEKKALTPEERAAKREAALARKRAKEAGEG
jgi:HEAT repeat protein